MHIIFYKSTPVLRSLLVPFLEECIIGRGTSIAVLINLFGSYGLGKLNTFLRFD